jgi:type II secretory pathway pseudopilin PulG
MTIKTRRYTSQAGITLLELVLAISILVIIMALNYSILKGVVQAKNIIDDKRDGMFIANSVLTRLARELQMATEGRALLPSCASLTGGAQQQQQQPNGAPSSPSEPRRVLVGEYGALGQDSRNDTLTFLAKEAGQYIPDGGTHSGIVQITYRVEQDPEARPDKSEVKTYLLVRDEVPYQRPPEKACANAIRFPITKDLVSLSFKYYDKKSKAWSDTWNENRSVRLPTIIQFTVTLKTPAGELESYTSSIALRSDK